MGAVGGSFLASATPFIVRHFGFESSYKPQLKNCWESIEADRMGRWKAFWNLQGFTRRVKAKVDFGLHAAADVSGWKPVEIG
jgi:hypothetical protein